MSAAGTNMQRYLGLLRSFVEQGLTADEFEARYLVAFKSDQSFHDKPIYDVLNSLFHAVDAYCADESIRGSDGLELDELLIAAQGALSALEELIDDGKK